MDRVCQAASIIASCRRAGRHWRRRSCSSDRRHLAPSMSIPKRIHHTWKSDEIPYHLAYYYRSWQKHHPDWEFFRWTDTTLADFVEREYPERLEPYRSFSRQIDRVNAARYLILKKY